MQRFILPLFASLLGASCGSDSFPFYPFDTSPTPTDGAGDAGVDLGPVGCQGPEDCAETEACIDNVCLPTCVSDEDCGGETPLCDTDAGLCVECLSESNCGPDETCVETVCVSICNGPEDCDGGECVEGACVPLEPICTAGETRCQADAIETCSDDGAEWLSEICEDGECVVANGVAACTSPECVAGERGCFDAQTAFECAADGSERVAEPCGEQAECQDGECIELRPPCVELSSGFVDFGVVRVGEISEVSISLSACDESVRIEGLAVEGGAEWFFLTVREPPFTLDGTEELLVEFAPDEPGEFFGEIVAQFAGGEEVVELVGDGAPAETECAFPSVGCRSAELGEFAEYSETRLGSDVECTGRFTEAEVAEYQWRLVDAPAASDVELPGTSAETILFAPDLGGTYGIELSIVDTEGVSGCEPAYAEVVVFNPDPPEGFPALQASLTWDTEADLDNHMLRDEGGAWNDVPDDCHWRNMNPEWGASLDVDDRDGFGPENIQIETDEPVTVRLGARARGIGESGPTVATMRLFVDGELTDELEVRFTADDQFWEVWDVSISADGAEVVELDSLTATTP